MWIVTGNTMTAATICEYIKKRYTKKYKIFINGATSSIGKAVIFQCSKLGYKVSFYTTSEIRAEKLLTSLKKEDVTNVKWVKRY